MWLAVIDNYSEVIKKMYFFLLLLAFQVRNTPGNHTIVGFYHDSLNLLNSV